VPHDIASTLTAGQIAGDENTLSVWVVCPERWFPGGGVDGCCRDGRAFAGEVKGMDV